MLVPRRRRTAPTAESRAPPIAHEQPWLAVERDVCFAVDAVARAGDVALLQQA
jgi:hypothetical protein